MKSMVLLAATACVALPTGTSAQEANPTPPAATPAEDPAVVAQRDLQDQEAILTRANSTQTQRDEAAARLVSRDNGAADAVLMRVLDNPNNREAQIAVARALIADTTPNTDFIPLLGRILGGGVSATEASAKALVTFRNSPQARLILERFITNFAVLAQTRQVAVRAMGQLVDKPAAAFLIGRLNDPQETNTLVRNAAMDALADMTGRTDFGQDVQRWQNWWGINQDRPDIDWLRDRLERSAQLRANAEKGRDSLRDFAEQTLFAHYRQQTADDKKAEVLRTAFGAASEDARAIAVGILTQEVGRFPQSPVYRQLAEGLRGMVGDSSPRVRQQVVATLSAAVDPQIVDVILARLPQETDENVRREMVLAIGAQTDVRAVNVLLDELRSDQYAIAQAAADAIARIATTNVLREPQNQALGTLVATRLRDRWNSTRGDPAAGALRETIAEAMSLSGHPLLRQELIQLTNLPEGRFRGFGYRGLGRTGLRELAGAVVGGLGDGDAPVRLHAVDAIAKIGGYEQAPLLGRLLDPAREPDEQNRTRVWEVFLTLLQKAPRGQELDFWVNQFGRGNNELDHTRRARVLEIQEKMYEAQNDAMRLAVTRTNLGQELLELAMLDKNAQSQIPRAELSAIKLAEALDWHQKQNSPPAATQPLMNARLRALFLARKYADGITFALQIVPQNLGFLENVEGAIIDETKRLEQLREYTLALQLLEESKRLPLPAVAQRRLQNAQDRIAQMRNVGGHAWPSPYYAGRDNASVPATHRMSRSLA